jgi:hypothetical protein
MSADATVLLGPDNGLGIADRFVNRFRDGWDL